MMHTYTIVVFWAGGGRGCACGVDLMTLLGGQCFHMSTRQDSLVPFFFQHDLFFF